LTTGLPLDRALARELVAHREAASTLPRG